MGRREGGRERMFSILRKISTQLSSSIRIITMKFCDFYKKNIGENFTNGFIIINLMDYVTFRYLEADT